MGLLDTVIDWVSHNTLLAAGIVVAAFLLLLMLIVFIVLLMRRRSAAPEPAWEEQGPAQPDWSAGAAGYAGLDYGGAPTGGVPTIGPDAPAVAAGTQMAPQGLPPTPGPFAPPAAPPKPTIAEPAPPAAGGTVVIKRGPKLKMLGMLVDRKRSSLRFDVDKPAVTIGRAPGNTIVIDHPTVSRQHATIKLEKDEFRLYDLGSANGTFIGDTRVREPVTLEDGMLVRFGEREFTFKRVSLE